MSQQHQLIKTLKQQGIHNHEVLSALQKIPREQFVLPQAKKQAYVNEAQAIDCAQTISQPYIVALMTQALMISPLPQKILEIGTGSGYQTAILATLFADIWTVERIPHLYETAKTRLSKQGFKNIHYRLGDGSLGWQEAAPFDAIMVTAAATILPPALLAQLAPTGTMIIPLGQQHAIQHLTLLRKRGEKIDSTVLEEVAFVPLITSPD